MADHIISMELTVCSLEQSVGQVDSDATSSPRRYSFMLRREIELPHPADLADFPDIQVRMHEEPGVVSLRLEGDDGSEVDLTWDEVRRSVHVQWMQGQKRLLELTRELVTRVSVEKWRGSVELWITSEATDMKSELKISVGRETSIADASLEC